MPAHHTDGDAVKQLSRPIVEKGDTPAVMQRMSQSKMVGNKVCQSNTQTVMRIHDTTRALGNKYAKATLHW